MARSLLPAGLTSEVKVVLISGIGWKISSPTRSLDTRGTSSQALGLSWTWWTGLGIAEIGQQAESIVAEYGRVDTETRAADEEGIDVGVVALFEKGSVIGLDLAGESPTEMIGCMIYLSGGSGFEMVDMRAGRNAHEMPFSFPPFAVSAYIHRLRGLG